MNRHERRKRESQRSAKGADLFCRVFGNQSVVLCRHQLRELDTEIGEAVALGRYLRHTKDAHARIQADTIMPIDLSEAEQCQFAATMTRLFFWTNQTTKCDRCGHIATGDLTESTPEQRERWQRAVDLGNQDSDGSPA